MKNIIESKITETDQAEINDLITELENKFKNKTGVLSDEERRRYGSINEQNKLVVNKARDYRQSQPELSAPNIDWDEFEIDYQARLFLEKCINRFRALVHSLESTKMMHDYDNLQDALKDYGYSKYQEGAGEDGYSTKVDETHQLFAKVREDKPEEKGGSE